MLSDSIPEPPADHEPELKVEVREAKPRDSIRPGMVELVFTTVYDPKYSSATVERMALADLDKVKTAIAVYEAVRFASNG